ncbi:hypothetical protein A2U01_0045907 [Trifolium medium]|uniref:Uncharacterized protein n=1 Tax=Trifolium medium TaxID=97028 RepID=A0A392QK08_9FABA|nr:hypothetical protein [Trifolium medium]
MGFWIITTTATTSSSLSKDEDVRSSSVALHHQQQQQSRTTTRHFIIKIRSVQEPKDEDEPKSNLDQNHICSLCRRFPNGATDIINGLTDGFERFLSNQSADIEGSREVLGMGFISFLFRFDFCVRFRAIPNLCSISVSFDFCVLQI